MDPITYKEFILTIDKLMTSFRDGISDDYPLEKQEIFKNCRHISHWLGDIANMEDFKKNPPKIQLEVQQ